MPLYNESIVEAEIAEHYFKPDF